MAGWIHPLDSINATKCYGPQKLFQTDVQDPTTWRTQKDFKLFRRNSQETFFVSSFCTYQFHDFIFLSNSTSYKYKLIKHAVSSPPPIYLFGGWSLDHRAVNICTLVGKISFIAVAHCHLPRHQQDLRL
jgi:hypothetical protein